MCVFFAFFHYTKIENLVDQQTKNSKICSEISVNEIRESTLFFHRFPSFKGNQNILFTQQVFIYLQRWTGLFCKSEYENVSGQEVCFQRRLKSECSKKHKQVASIPPPDKVKNEQNPVKCLNEVEIQLAESSKWVSASNEKFWLLCTDTRGIVEAEPRMLQWL